MIREHAISDIMNKHSHYLSEMHELFEDFLFVEFYYPILHKQIKLDKIPVMRFESAHSNYKTPFIKSKIYGLLDRVLKRSNNYRTLCDSVALTEDYLQSITFRVYRDFPGKLVSKDESQKQQYNLINLIVKCEDKDEIISRVAEEKIRSIFYGNPTDFFVKDKARIGIQTNFEEMYNNALDRYKGILATRNAIVHNNGIIDRKYLREVSNSKYSIGSKIILGKPYIKETIHILTGLSTIVTKQVLETCYKAVKFSGRFNQRVSRFNKEWKS